MERQLGLNFLVSLILFSLAGSSQARNIKVSVPAQSVSHVGFYVAKDRGYYRDEGVDVELILMNAAVAVRALIGGDVDFTTVGGSGVPPILRGAPRTSSSFCRSDFSCWAFSVPYIGFSPGRTLPTLKVSRGKKWPPAASAALRISC